MQEQLSLAKRVKLLVVGVVLMLTILVVFQA